MYRSEKLQKLLEEFGGIQKMVMVKLEGKFLPLYIHDLSPFLYWKSSISVYANIKPPREEADYPWMHWRSMVAL